MIELFSRSDCLEEKGMGLIPIHIDDSVSSLSAILLNDAYYQLLLQGRTVIEEISILQPSCLILFKVKAWLDLNKRLAEGEHVDSRDIKKHKNDIVRMVSEIVLEPCKITEEVRADMVEFIREFHVTDAELKNLKIHGVHETEIIKTLEQTFNLW